MASHPGYHKPSFVCFTGRSSHHNAPVPSFPFLFFGGQGTSKLHKLPVQYRQQDARKKSDAPVSPSSPSTHAPATDQKQIENGPIKSRKQSPVPNNSTINAVYMKP